MKVSIIIPCHNEEKYLNRCIDSMLNQSYKNFELIIIDDASTDNSLEIIKIYKDKRIKLIKNKKSLGGAKSRNEGIKNSKGEILFFIDSDCYADKDWIKNGLDCFKQYKCVGVEGQLYYISKDYKSALSDQLTVDLNNHEQYMTGNMAYTKKTFKKTGLFDPEFKFHIDREFGLRIKKFGEIIYCKDMIVTHMKKKWSIKGFINNGKRIEYQIKLYLKYNDKINILLRIVYPKNLLKILIPPLAFIGPLIKGKIKTKDDWKLFIFIYPNLIVQRITIWKTAIKEKVILI